MSIRGLYRRNYCQEQSTIFFDGNIGKVLLTTEALNNKYILQPTFEFHGNFMNQFKLFVNYTKV